jgi:hypothetical protein
MGVTVTEQNCSNIIPFQVLPPTVMCFILIMNRSINKNHVDFLHSFLGSVTGYCGCSERYGIWRSLENL